MPQSVTKNLATGLLALAVRRSNYSARSHPQLGNIHIHIHIFKHFHTLTSVLCAFCPNSLSVVCLFCVRVFVCERCAAPFLSSTLGLEMGPIYSWECQTRRIKYNYFNNSLFLTCYLSFFLNMLSFKIQVVLAVT
jgi:hypothetical protein